MKIPKKIVELAEIFNKNNYKLYLVGGAVRDYLIGKKNFDYDFATDAEPSEVMKLFRSVIPVGIQHGTVIVIYKGSEYEITTFRTDGKYSDNRHPDQVSFIKSLDEDLKRRDFTINALAFDILNKKLIDNFNGKKDLKHHTIKAIGNPAERFEEDALRMLRACRFSSKLNFKIEKKTFNAIKTLADNINSISAERIRDELIKIMHTDKPSIGLEQIRLTGLMKHILPELLNCYEVHQNKFHKHDVYYHNLYTCDAAESDNHQIRLAALFHDIAKPQTRREKEVEENENTFYNHEIIGSRIAYRILKRLKFSNHEIKHITHLIKHHMFFYTSDWTDGAVRRFIRNIGVENIEDLFKLRLADRIGNGMKSGIPDVYIKFKDRIEKILEIDNAFKVTDLDINGTMIMQNIDLKPGPIIGEILNYLLELVLDDPALNVQETLMQKAVEYYNTKKDYSLSNYGKPPEELGKF